MKKEEKKQFIRYCVLGAIGGILMAAGDWLLRCVPFQKTDTDLYTSLILSEKLYPHLLEIDRVARERMDAMLPRMMEEACVTEELKACDSMKWVGLMITLKAQAEEVIFRELIYA